MDWLPIKSPLKNNLFVRRPLSNAILRSLDWLFRVFSFWKKKPTIPTKFQRILVCNIASFGDVLISTLVLPLIKKKYPGCEIGFLTSSLSAIVLKEHPLISRLHFFDHWVLNIKKGWCKSALQHFRTAKKAFKELRENQYEVAIDLYSYFPNAIPLLILAKIPIRIGYTSGGFSSLLTHKLTWQMQDQYVGYSHLNLLKFLGIDEMKSSPIPTYFIKKGKVKVLPDKYIVIHMGSSNSIKEWGHEKWDELLKNLKELPIVLTGQGEREQDLCDKIAALHPCLNLCNHLEWHDFVSVIEGTKLLVSVDSVSVHIAAAFQVPTIVLFTGVSSPWMWRPPYPECKGVIAKVSCAPCFDKKGCSKMACIKNITAEEVYKASLELLVKAAAEPPCRA